MPLANLGELLLYAIKKETEKQIYPIWLVHFLISNLPGNESMELIPLDTLLNDITQKNTENIKAKSGKDILSEFESVIKADIEQRSG